ncbi:MAG: hypothetical protein OXK16_13160 [bacterium]|nr:hypothetical protein [bacterium]
MAVLVGLIVPAVGQPDTEAAEPLSGDLTVTANFVGVTVDGHVPNPTETGSVTYTLADDGTSEVLWASSADALEDGVVARWTGTLTDSQVGAARDYVRRVIVCTVEADRPTYNEDIDGMDSSGWQVCTGNWYKHKVKGWLQYRYVYTWRTGDKADSGWEYQDETVLALHVEGMSRCETDGLADEGERVCA